MPSTSSISATEKSLIKKNAASSTDKVRWAWTSSVCNRFLNHVKPQILSGAIARIYYASPDPAQWSWAGLEGALVFGNTSKGTGGFWFKLVDIVVCLGDCFVLSSTEIILRDTGI